VVSVSDPIDSRASPSITARPTVAEKLLFASMAAARGISESKLALVAIRMLLESGGHGFTGALPPSTRDLARDRITIRPRPGDRRFIRERAKKRGLKDSAYISALVRS